MLPYWLLFSLFATGAVGHVRRASPALRPTPLLTVAALIAAAMIGLRYEAGADWDNYMQIYLLVGHFDLRETLTFSDPGYSVLNWLAHRLGLGLWFVNSLCGLILMWGLVAFARRQPNPWLAVLVAVPYLIIVVAMGYSRQAVALGFVFAGLAILDRSSIVRFSFYVIAGALFHKSAVTVLPLVALAASRHRFATAAALILLGIMTFFLFIRADIDRLYSVYIEAEYASEGAAIRVAMSLVPATIFLAFQNRFMVAENQLRIWRNFALSSYVLLGLLLVLPSSTAVDRVALYLIPLQIFVFSRLPHAFPEKGRPDAKLVLLIVAYCGLIQFVWFNYAKFAEFWLPYQAYFISEDVETEQVSY